MTDCERCKRIDETFIKQLDALEALAKEARPGEWGPEMVEHGADYILTGDILAVTGPIGVFVAHATSHADVRHIAACNPQAILDLVSRCRLMEEALQYYAQKPEPDITTEFAKSAGEWGETVATWEPLTDLGERARQALATVNQGDET